MCLATGRPVPDASQAERDLVAECLVAAREAKSPWDEAKAADRERASLLDRRAAGEMRRVGCVLFGTTLWDDLWDDLVAT